MSIQFFDTDRLIQTNYMYTYLYMKKNYLLSKLQTEVSAATPKNFATGITAQTEIELRVQIFLCSYRAY